MKGISPALYLLGGLGFAAGIALAVVILRGESTENPGGPDPSSRGSSKQGTRLPPELVGDPDLARADRARREGRMEEAVQLLNVVCRRHPDRPEPQLYLGQVLEARGERDRAEQAYLRASRLKPAGPEPFYRLGRIAEDRGQNEVAIEQYRKALKADPTHGASCHYLAIQLRGAGSFKEAEQLLLDSLVREPKNTGLRLNLAHTYLEEGDGMNAVEHFQKAISMGCQQEAEAYYFLGRARELLGQEAEALAALQEALKRDAHLEMAWYTLAQLRQRRGEEREAENAFQEFRKARELKDRLNRFQDLVGKHPRDPALLVEYGKALLERGRPRQALEVLRRACELDRKNREARGLLNRAVEELRAKSSG